MGGWTLGLRWRRLWSSVNLHSYSNLRIIYSRLTNQHFWRKPELQPLLPIVNMHKLLLLTPKYLRPVLLKHGCNHSDITLWYWMHFEALFCWRFGHCPVVFSFLLPYMRGCSANLPAKNVHLPLLE